jgi:arylsulfatase
LIRGFETPNINPHSLGFDETFLSVYNQVTSLFNEIDEGANALMGLKEEMLVKNSYKLDDSFVPKGYVMNVEGREGELGREWGGVSHDVTTGR